MKASMYFMKDVVATISLFIIIMANTGGAFADEPKDFSRLVEFIELEDRIEPLFPFNDYELDSDESSHREYLEYINNQPNLLLNIQSRLGSDKLHWKLDNLSHRLLFVPENRKKYATLYETYCHDVIDYILDKTRLDNPYRTVQTLFEEKPGISDDGEGITAFLVHNIVEESSASYIFSNQKGKKVKIELNSRAFSGTVGSYTTNIYIRDNEQFEFKRNKYTIWQNSAKNPYTALMVPAEETLHIALRGYTETAIKASLEETSQKTLAVVEGVVDDWMSVEEAIVGGLVYSLLPSLVDKYLDNKTQRLIKADLDKKEKLIRYKHLKRGIGLVEELGYIKAIKMYKDDPNKFKTLLEAV